MSIGLAAKPYTARADRGGGSASFTVSLTVDGVRALPALIADVAEGTCPVYRVRLIPHCDRECCPCGGCSYRVASDPVRLEMLAACELHPARQCEHCRKVWGGAGP